MKLTDDQVKAFQSLYAKRFGVALSSSEASAQGLALIGLMTRVYSPIKATATNENYYVKKRQTTHY